MDKIGKMVLSIMFIVLCSLIGLALIDEGRQRQLENLDKPMLKQDVFSLGISVIRMYFLCYLCLLTGLDHCQN